MTTKLTHPEICFLHKLLIAAFREPYTSILCVENSYIPPIEFINKLKIRFYNPISKIRGGFILDNYINHGNIALIYCTPFAEINSITGEPGTIRNISDGFTVYINIYNHNLDIPTLGFMAHTRMTYDQISQCANILDHLYCHTKKLTSSHLPTMQLDDGICINVELTDNNNISLYESYRHNFISFYFANAVSIKNIYISHLGSSMPINLNGIHTMLEVYNFEVLPTVSESP